MSEPFKTYYFEDLSVGMRETLMKTVMNEDIVGFAELSGDPIPSSLGRFRRARPSSASASPTACLPPA